VISSTDLITTGYQVNTHLYYDAQQRPITITLEDHDASLPTTTVTMATVNFGYNALGQRSAYTSTTAGYPALSYAAHLQYRDGQLAQAVVISGTATGSTTYTDTYVYDQGGNPLELIRARSSGVTDRYWYELDGRGNVVALTDATGAAVDRYRYDIWGEPSQVIEAATARQQLRYAGYWYDAKLGWYWLSVRSYEPEGRFLQPDPSMIEGTRSYIYVDDNPIDATDPLGLGPLDRNCTLAYQFGGTRRAAVPCWFDPAGHLIYDVSGLQCFDTALFSGDPAQYRLAAAGCAVISVTGGTAVAKIGWRAISHLPGFGVAIRAGGRYIGGAFVVGRDVAANALGAGGHKVGDIL